MCGDQRTTFENQFCPSVWDLFLCSQTHLHVEASYQTPLLFFSSNSHTHTHTHTHTQKNTQGREREREM